MLETTVSNFATKKMYLGEVNSWNGEKETYPKSPLVRKGEQLYIRYDSFDVRGDDTPTIEYKWKGQKVCTMEQREGVSLVTAPFAPNTALSIIDVYGYIAVYMPGADLHRTSASEDEEEDDDFRTLADATDNLIDLLIRVKNKCLK